MQTRGTHLLVEYRGCDADILDDAAHIEASLVKASALAGATMVSKTFHRFAPQGVSGVVVVEESHLSIHTWPEAGYAAIDFFTCGDCLPERAHEYIMTALGAQQAEVMEIERGRTQSQSMEVKHHRQESISEENEKIVTPAQAAVA